MERILLPIIFALVAGFFFSEDSTLAAVVFIGYALLASIGYFDVDNVDNKKSVK